MKNSLGQVMSATQKPQKLCNYLVAGLSDPDDIVIDAYSGTGTFAVSCALFGRHSISLETNKDAFETIVARLSQTKAVVEDVDFEKPSVQQWQIIDPSSMTSERDDDDEVA